MAQIQSLMRIDHTRLCIDRNIPSSVYETLTERYVPMQRKTLEHDRLFPDGTLLDTQCTQLVATRHGFFIIDNRLAVIPIQGRYAAIGSGEREVLAVLDTFERVATNALVGMGTPVSVSFEERARIALEVAAYRCDSVGPPHHFDTYVL